MSQPQLKPSKSRDPPPSLFLHPTPSPSASHVSLVGAAAPGAAMPPNASQPLAPTTTSSTTQPPMQPLSRKGSLLNPMNMGGRGGAPVPRLHTGDSSRSVDKTDALWAEMQATLEEVELSASGGTHVFGPEHDRKLADLRAAQIALAQAWARSEADDAIETTGAGTEEVRDLKNTLGGMGLAAASNMAPGATLKDGTTDPGRSTIGSGSAARPSSSGRGADRFGAALEEETETDILLARKRREANDQYFSRVDQGVRDVVAKLEEVAVAMHAVEQESRDVWGEDTPPGSAKHA
ncbi:hypothetical protein PG984_006514 [Apiospora sp. TS-2023a]